MKTIKIFLASSEELEEDRVRIGDFVGNRLNKICKERGFCVELEKWEDFDDSYTGERTQDMYNRTVCDSDLFVALFYRRAGKYTLEEVGKAFESLRQHNKPKVCVYIKCLVDEKEETPELKEFKSYLLNDLQHFTSPAYKHIDSIFLNITLQVQRLENNRNMKLEAQGDNIMIGNQKLLSLRNIPFAANNEQLQDLRNQIAECERTIASLEPVLLTGPNEAIEKLIYDQKVKRNNLEEKVKQMQNSLLDTALTIVQMQGKVHNERLSRAIALFEQGDNKGANAILDLREIDNDAKRNAQLYDAAQKVVEGSRQAIMVNIEEYKLKIKTLSNEMQEGWLEQVIDVYNKAVEIARGRIERSEFAQLLFDYADFLRIQKQYQRNILDLYDESLREYELLVEEGQIDYEQQVALLMNDRAIVHHDLNRYDEAEVGYSKAFEIRKRIAERKHDVCNADVAESLYNLACIYQFMNRYEDSETYYLESLSLRRALAKENPEVYNRELSQSLNNLAGLYQYMNRYEDSEKYYLESLALIKNLAKENPAVYNSSLASSLNNLGNLYYRQNRYSESEDCYQESLSLRRELSVANPEVFQYDLSVSLNKLGELYFDQNRYSESEDCFLESLSLRRELAVSNPEVYNDSLSVILNNLAVLYDSMNRDEGSEKYYLESLVLTRSLAKENPAVYNYELSVTLSNLAKFYRKMNRYEDSEKYYLESLVLIRSLAKENPAVYNNTELASCLCYLASLQVDKNQTDAESYYRESLSLYKELAKDDPERYTEKVDECINALKELEIKKGTKNEDNKSLFG